MAGNSRINAQLLNGLDSLDPADVFNIETPQNRCSAVRQRTMPLLERAQNSEIVR